MNANRFVIAGAVLLAAALSILMNAFHGDMQINMSSSAVQSNWMQIMGKTSGWGAIIGGLALLAFGLVLLIALIIAIRDEFTARSRSR
jgi:hypothetical protein